MGPGSRLEGYELVRLLGAGGMGEVWLATDLRLGRKVAIKLLPAALTSDPARVARFEHEARAASSLNHPNVCTIHTLGNTQDGQRFIAMELVEGQSLRQRMAPGALPRAEVLSISVQTAAALTASHAAGVIHRDLKPENVMLRPDGLVKVVDFGLAKLTDVGNATSTTQMMAHTVAGSIVGTVMYMSPEQARGLAVDARTDVWSLGVMLFEMLEGHPPFHGETSADILAAILGSEPALRESGSGASQELRRIIGKALRKDREQRYQVMKDLELDLQALRDEREPQATADSAGTAAAVRRRTPLWIAAAAIVAAAVGFGWWRLANHPAVTSPLREVRRAAIDRPLTRLTFDPGLQTDPAFSPDGRSIAYASDRNGNFDVWVQPVEGGQARQITTSSAQETQPAWSPDGKTLIYRSEGSNGGLFTVPAEGGPERRVTSFGEHPEWISDREILFVDGYGSDRSRLFVVSPDGMDSPHPLLEDVVRGDHWAWIAARPDGRISMLGWDKTGATKFVTASRDGRQVITSAIPRVLHLEHGGEDLRRFSWSPSGDTIYLETLEQGVATLRKIYVDRESLGWREAERLTQGTDDAVGATLARDGTRIAYSSQRTATQMWTFPLEGDPLRLGKGKAMSPSEGRAANITLSPDGRYAAYVMNRPGAKHFELTLTDLAAGTSKLLALDGWSPAWSRDSRTLAYIVTRVDDQGQAFAMVTRPLDGAERMLKRWSDESIFLPSSWTDDGAVLGSFVKPLYGRSVLAIWTSPADTPARVLVASDNASIWQGSPSPNGRWLSVTVSPQDGAAFVAIVPATGAASAKWAIPFGRESVLDKPRWSADGRTLFVLAKNGHPFLNLWSMRIDPARGTPIGALTQVSGFDSPGLGISPVQGENEIGIAAHVAALPMTTARGGIWMMENVDK